MTEWQEFKYRSRDGLILAGRKYGWDITSAMPVVCLPGLSRNSADFHELAVHLSKKTDVKRRVLCLDYRGRGQSEYDKNWNNYNILTEADDVVQAMNATGLSHAHFIGTSRGGLIIMVLAAMKPVLLKSVILNDIGPEIDGAGLVRLKRMFEGVRTVSNWDEAAQLLQEFGHHDFPDRELSDWQAQAKLIYSQQKDKMVRLYDPNLVKTLQAIDLDSRLPTLWPQFEGLKNLSMLLIRGQLSSLLNEQTVEKMCAINPNMKVLNIPNQGHTPDIGHGNIPQNIGQFLNKI